MIQVVLENELECEQYDFDIVGCIEHKNGRYCESVYLPTLWLAKARNKKLGEVKEELKLSPKLKITIQYDTLDSQSTTTSTVR